MISTTANSKVKAPKGTECVDAPDRDEIVQENTDDKVRGYVGAYDASSSFGGPSRDGRYRSRGRVTEFRPSRGGGRGGRGRGGFPPRGDREPLDNSFKYHETLNQSSNDTWAQGNSSNKFYERPELVVNLPEDPRISKLLRRLCAEVDMEKSLVICSKLQDAVMLPENSRYIRRSYDILVESLLDVLYDAPGPETKEGASVVLGRIGYVMGPDFRKHLEWVAASYAVHNTSIKHYLTLSFTETFQLDYQTPHLADFAEITLDRLQTIIEGTDSADVFMCAINAMIILSNSYPEHFANHFVDTVDILVGWHVDNAQPKKIKDFALQSLLKLSRHWQADVGFSVNLLNQFVEDMVAYSTEMEPNRTEKQNDATTPEDCMLKITSFLNVFNTVVKSLGTLLSPTVSQIVSWSFLSEAFTKILQVLSKTMKNDAEADLILAAESWLEIFNTTDFKNSTNSTLLRYGHQQIKECKDFEKTYNCIQGCLSRDYQIAKADKDCRCFCLKDATKAKYFDQISVTKRAPTTTIPGKFVSTTTTIKYDDNNYENDDDPEDLVQVVSEKVPQPIENGSISNETTSDGNSTVESTTDGNYIEDTTSDGYYIDESTSDANYNVETTMEE